MCKQKIPATKCYPSVHWTWDLSHLDRMLSLICSILTGVTFYCWIFLFLRCKASDANIANSVCLWKTQTDVRTQNSGNGKESECSEESNRLDWRKQTEDFLYNLENTWLNFLQKSKFFLIEKQYSSELLEFTITCCQEKCLSRVFP